jgi:hypothetical protein
MSSHAVLLQDNSIRFQSSHSTKPPADQDVNGANLGLVEVVDDGGPVDLVPTGEPVDGCTHSVQVDQLFDLGFGQPSLHRV